MLLSTLLALAAAGTLDLLGPDGRWVGSAREGPGGRVEIFDKDSKRIGWGRRGGDGSLELFDMKGNRIGAVTPDGKALRLERPRRQNGRR